MKYFLNIILDGLLTRPALEDMELAVGLEAHQVDRALVVEAVVKYPDSSAGQFTPSSATLSLNVREVFIVLMVSTSPKQTSLIFIFLNYFEMKTALFPVQDC